MIMIPSKVNDWVYGHLIKSFTLVAPHGPAAEGFEQWNIDEVVSMLALSCPKLEDLNLSGCTQVTDQSLCLVANHCSKLQKLNLNRCDLVSSTTVYELAKGCTELVILNLSRPLLSQQTVIVDDSILALVQRTPKLMELRLRNCDLLSDRTVIEMTQTCGSNLRALDLR
jgi:F-box and leucine-rich repeat protein GRR1